MTGALGAGRHEPARQEDGDQRRRERERDEHGHCQRECEGAKEGADDALQQAEGGEDDHRREGRARDRPEDSHRWRRGRPAREPRPGAVRPALDVLDHYDGVVDHQPDGDRQSAEGHQVQRLVSQVEAQQCDRHRHGQRQGGRHGRPPAAQEEQQHRDRERAPHQHRVPNAGHGRSHQLSLVVDRFESHACREQRSHRVERRTQTTARWSARVLPSGWRAMLMSAAGRPFPETICQRSWAP